MKKSAVIIFGVLLAFLVGALLLEFQGFDSLTSYASMFKNSLFTNIALGNTLSRMAIFIVLGLSAFFGFNSGVSNLGLFGQLLMGALTASLIGVNVQLPSFILIPLMLILAGLAGGLYASIAGLLKLYFKMNEFITTLMMNFIAEYFVTYLVTYPLRDVNSQWPMSAAVSKSAIFPKIGIFDFSIFLSLIIFSLIVIFWNKTRRGYEFRLTGANSIFSKVGGCTISKNFLSAMIISGLLAGIAGGFLIMGTSQQNKLIPSLGKTNANDGLMIAIISGNNLPSVLFFSIFFGILQTGAVGMQLDTNVPSEFMIILQATMVLFVVAFRDYSDTFINTFKAFLKSKEIKEGGNESNI